MIVEVTLKYTNAVNTIEGFCASTECDADKARDHIPHFLEAAARILIEALEENGKINPKCAACEGDHRTHDCPELT